MNSLGLQNNSLLTLLLSIIIIQANNMVSADELPANILGEWFPSEDSKFMSGEISRTITNESIIKITEDGKYVCTFSTENIDENYRLLGGKTYYIACHETKEQRTKGIDKYDWDYLISVPKVVEEQKLLNMGYKLFIEIDHGDNSHSETLYR